jgi:hypothetical protein
MITKMSVAFAISRELLLSQANLINFGTQLTVLYFTLRP